jgi:hypothetical protein
MFSVNPTADGIAVITDVSAAGVWIITLPLTAAPDVFTSPLFSSVPVAFVLNVIVPDASALYVHVNVADAPPAIVAAIGVSIAITAPGMLAAGVIPITPVASA